MNKIHAVLYKFIRKYIDVFILWYVYVCGVPCRTYPAERIIEPIQLSCFAGLVTLYTATYHRTIATQSIAKHRQTLGASHCLNARSSTCVNVSVHYASCWHGPIVVDCALQRMATDLWILGLL